MMSLPTPPRHGSVGLHQQLNVGIEKALVAVTFAAVELKQIARQSCAIGSLPPLQSALHRPHGLGQITRESEESVLIPGCNSLTGGINGAD